MKGGGRDLRREGMMTRKETKHAFGSFLKTLFGFGGLMLAGALHMSAGEIGQAGDDQIRRAAERAVRTNPFLTVFDHVIVDVDGGYVQLRGSVERRHRREAVAAVVARLPGVVGLRNEIDVQSSSPADVSLRRRLFESIYYGGVLAANAEPEWQVRIVVDGERVTLFGDVPSSAGLERLEAVARNAGALAVDVRPEG
jgi:osmotically-inducible protein OsmY